MKKANKKQFENLLVFIIFISNLSQIPLFFGNNLIKSIIMCLWLSILFFITMGSYWKKININVIKYLFPLFLFDLLILIFQVFTGQMYIKSNFIYPVHLSALILLIGYLIGQIIDYKTVKKTLNSYIVSSIIVAIYVYIRFFREKNWIESGYLYGSKNSLSIILLISIILIFIYWHERNVFLNIGICTFILFIIFMMKSRATILATIVVLIYFIFFILKDRKKKFFFLLCIFVILMFILSSEKLSYLIINNIILNNKENMGIDAISSGRIDHLNEFFYMFKKYWIIGNGGIYLESFLLATLCSYGVFAGGLLIIFSIIPLFIVFKYKSVKKYKTLNIIILLISLIMIINSLFEELTPFGPGIKCYILWLMTGIYLSFVRRKGEKNFYE